jgi:hypothetical protein
MGFLSSKPKEPKLPGGPRRGQDMMRYVCNTCGGWFRTASSRDACERKHEGA